MRAKHTSPPQSAASPGLSEASDPPNYRDTETQGQKLQTEVTESVELSMLSLASLTSQQLVL